MRKLTYWLVGLALIGVAIGAVLLLNNIREIPWTAAENAVCEPTLADAGGVDISSAFRFTFEGDVSANAVRRFLTVEPTIELNFHQGLQAKEVLTVPVEPLQPGTVYRFSLATDTETLHWAFQTKQEWRVQSASPAHTATEVSPNCAVEFYFNQSLAADITLLPDYLHIVPEVAGRFEQAGNCLRFIPEQPLSPRAVYTVTLSAGLPAADSDAKLAEDFSFAFETANGDGSALSPLWQAEALAASFLPGRLPAFACDFYDGLGWEWAAAAVDGQAGGQTADQEQGPPLYAALYRYADAEAYAEDVLALQRRTPAWSFSGRYPQGADTAALTFVTAVELHAQPAAQGYRFSWPTALPPGCYILQASYRGESRDIRFQVSPLTAFVQAALTESLIWAHEAQAGLPAAAGQVTHINSGITGQTDEDGLLRLALSHELTPLDEQGSMLARQDVYVLRCGQAELVLQDFGLLGAAETAAGADIWSYAVLNQESYQGGDTLEFWGYMRRRDNADWDWSRVSVYVCAAGEPGQPVAQGYAPLNSNIFHGSLPLPRLLPGLYELQIWQSGQMLISKNFTVDATPIYMRDTDSSKLRLSSGKDAYAIQEDYTLRLEGAEGGPAPYLFIKSGGGLQEAVVEREAQHRGVFGPEDVGGAYWQAVVFDGQHYQITPYYSLGAESLSHSLRVEAAVEDDVIRFTVRDAAGNAPAKAGLAALVAPPGRAMEDMAAALYAGNRPSGLLGGAYAHDGGAWPSQPSAEKAFCFAALELDNNGQAELALTESLPPGAWQLYAWAVADDALPLAGCLTMELAAAQPKLSIGALAAYRVGDAPQLSLSWQYLPAEAQNRLCSYTVEISGPDDTSTLHLAGQGTVYFTLPALNPGTYRLSAATQLAGVTYRAEHSFTVERPAVTLYRAAPYQAGVALEAGWLYISSGARVQAMELLWQVLNGADGGAEQRWAAAYAARLWQDYGAPGLTLAEKDALPALSAFQQTDGGLAAWPDSPSDLPLSLLAASLTREGLDICDEAALSRYLSGRAAGAITFSDRAMALAGLAALGQPVLQELKLLYAQEGITPYARACLIWGLLQCEDTQVAKAAFHDLLTAYVSDATAGLLYLEGGQGDNIRLNRLGAMLAASCGEAQTAYALLQYLQNQQAADPLTTALTAGGLLQHLYAAPASASLTLSWRSQQAQIEGYSDFWLELTEPGPATLEKISGDLALTCLTITKAEIPAAASAAPGLTLKREAQLKFNENGDTYLAVRVDYELAAGMTAGEYALCEYIPTLAEAGAAQVLSGQRYRLAQGDLIIALPKKAGVGISGYLEYMLPVTNGGQAAFPPTVLRTPDGRLYTAFAAEVLRIE